MLLSFRFANHRSFRDEQHLNLTPVYPGDLEGSEPRGAVSVAGIFGANASGKSNSLHALAMMKSLVLGSDREVEPDVFKFRRFPFRLDVASEDEPSRYVVDMRVGTSRYSYGFTVNSKCVLEEWLFEWPANTNRKNLIYERVGQKFEWGDRTKKDANLTQIADLVHPSALFISTISRLAPKAASDSIAATYRWFARLRTRFRPGPGVRAAHWGFYWYDMHDDDKLVVKNLLSAADVGIVDVSLKPLPEEIMDSIQSDDMDAAQIRRIERNRAREQKLQFAHRSASGSVMMDIDDESTGTQQLLDLAVDVAFTLRYGTVMTVDEIDASLHPMLTARLIWLFQHAATNPRFGQLIFTSHDATLLGNFEGEEVLHRDQIWFAEKADDGSSVLYPLVEFKPRKDENRQRRYLNGSYGGVPELSEDVFEQALILRGDIDGEGQE